MTGEVKRNVSPPTGGRVFLMASSPWELSRSCRERLLGIARAEASWIGQQLFRILASSCFSRNNGRRFLKLVKQSAAKHGHHGSIGDSSPMAFFGSPRGHRVEGETRLRQGGGLGLASRWILSLVPERLTNPRTPTGQERSGFGGKATLKPVPRQNLCGCNFNRLGAQRQHC